MYFAPTTIITVTVCSEFASAFDNFYELRNTADYPGGNPMRKNEQLLGNNVLNILKSVTFPINYILKQDQGTG